MLRLAWKRRFAIERRKPIENQHRFHANKNWSKIVRLVGVLHTNERCPNAKAKSARLLSENSVLLIIGQTPGLTVQCLHEFDFFYPFHNGLVQRP